MRKFLALLLVFCMFSSMNVFAVEINDYSEITYHKQVELLTELGIMTLDKDNFMPKSAMTRAEYVDTIVRFIGLEIGNYNTSTRTDVYDVTEYTDYSSSVLFALDLGIVSGKGDGTFAPDEIISTTDAVVICMNALGYKELALSSGGYPSGYLSLANRLGVTEGINLSDEFTRELCAVMLYNAADAEILTAFGFNGDGSVKYSSSKNETVLSKYFDVYEAEGLVVEQEYEMEGDDAAKGYVRFEDGTRFYYTGTEDFAGKHVKLFYKYNEEENTSQVILIKEDESVGILKIDASDAVFANNVYTYDDTKTAKIGALTRIFYNGAELESYNAAYMSPKIGTIELSDNSGGYYRLLKITSYTDCVVDMIDTDFKIVYDKYNFDSRFEYDGVNYVAVNSDGSKTNINNVKSGSVMSVAKSADGKTARILLSSEAVSGVVSGTTTENNFFVCTVEGAEYKISPQIVSLFKNEIAAGDEVTLFLNAFRIAAGFEKGKISGAVFAYMLAAKPDEKPFNDNITLKLYTEKGELLKLNTRDKVTIDGSLRPAANCLSDLSGSQLICYETDAEGLISRIDTAYTETKGYGIDETENSLFKFYESESSVYSSTMSTFAGIANVNSATRILFIPEDPITAYEDDFATTYKFVARESYNIEAYKTVKDSFYADAIVIKETNSAATSFSHSTYMMMINKIYSGLNQNEEVVTFINCFYNGQENNFELSPKCNIKDLQPGDIIRALLDSRDRIYYAEMVWDRSDTNGYVFAKGNPSSTNYYDYSRFMYAGVHSTDGTIFRIGFESDLKNTKDSTAESFLLSKVGAIYVYGENRDGTWFKKGSVADMIPWKSNPQKYSKVLVRQYYSQPVEVIIFNN
ncbi:MAG: S-layer homology domain-containing protein [Clostridia bacterium]|nr:S-layer homology domain-containing protein [Clostridia bacterium]